MWHNLYRIPSCFETSGSKTRGLNMGVKCLPGSTPPLPLCWPGKAEASKRGSPSLSSAGCRNPRGHSYHLLVTETPGGTSLSWLLAAETIASRQEGGSALWETFHSQISAGLELFTPSRSAPCCFKGTAAEMEAYIAPSYLNFLSLLPDAWRWLEVEGLNGSEPSKPSQSAPHHFEEATENWGLNEGI